MGEKILELAPIDEIAQFWDTHDLTDFEDQLEEVSDQVFERGTETISIRILPQEIEAVKTILTEVL